jgi:Cft2 family RNA processing exonuclease
MQKSYKIVEFREKIKMKDFTVSFSPSGHIVGASMITVDDGKNRLIYAGDVNLAKTRLLEGRRHTGTSGRHADNGEHLRGKEGHLPERDG